MKNTKRFFTALATFGLCLAGTLSAEAQTPQPNVVDAGNRWLITAFADAIGRHVRMATQGLCFLPYAQVGTQIQGLWYSDTFPNWRGRYAQEGDRVVMHGDYARDEGHDGMVIELAAGTTPRDLGAGQWTEWREPGAFGRTIAFANATLRRVGRCRRIPLTARAPLEVLSATAASSSGQQLKALERAVEEVSASIPPRLLKNGEEATAPMQADQEPLRKEEEQKQ